ncbi:hypothetical protein ACIQ1H_09110 [Lysinibacillus sp. NPDC097279]|uniref:hypothetical protein n=1 Tax=Lysinibacillus sp. NPDC097279 TaxID=3364143 RepID=UPI0037FA2A56
MRKLPLVIIFFMVCSIISPTLALGAAKPYDQEELMQYPGYGKAMYETIVEETTFITGQYTDNKEYVNKSIDQIRDYGKFWWNEQNWESESWTYDRFKEMVAKPAGYLLTVGDWVKKLFTDYDESENAVDYEDFYNPYVYVSNEYLIARPGYQIHVEIPDAGSYTPGMIQPYLYYFNGDQYQTAVNLGGTKTYKTGPIVNAGFDAVKAFKDRIKANNKTVTGMLSLLVEMNVVVTIKEVKTDSVIQLPSGGGNGNVTKMRDFIDKNGVGNVATPQPRPYLSCPNGTKIEMSISGSTFLGIDGKVMIVNKDGTAQVDSAICNLGWDKPPIKYIEDRAAIQTPDGKWQDAETGETVTNSDKDGDDELEQDCKELASNMEVDSNLCKGEPYFGRKLEYMFGNATGNRHNIERSIAMELQLNSIGIFDDATGRKLVLDNLSEAFEDPLSILKVQDNGRIVRESILLGPNGVLKVESVWDEERLITILLYGGR